MGVGNNFGLVLDISRGGLEGPGREFKMGRNRQETVTRRPLREKGKTTPFGSHLVTAHPGS